MSKECYKGNYPKHPRGVDYVHGRDHDIDMAVKAVGWTMVRLPEHAFQGKRTAVKDILTAAIRR